MRFTLKWLSGRTTDLYGNTELTADAASSQIRTCGLLCLLKAQSAASVNVTSGRRWKFCPPLWSCFPPQPASAVRAHKNLGTCTCQHDHQSEPLPRLWPSAVQYCSFNQMQWCSRGQSFCKLTTQLWVKRNYSIELNWGGYEKHF